MKIVIDTHFHLYPVYHLENAFKALQNNLSAPVPEHIKCAVLTEAPGFSYFQKLSKGEALAGSQFNLKVISRNCVQLNNGKDQLFLFNGRQHISSEGLEILSLFNGDEIHERSTAAEIIEIINERGGIPVLSWAPGKWFFKRGKIIQQLLKASLPGRLIIGDTSLRPVGWPMPKIMKEAREMGFTIIFGSDPLPLRGEEETAGRYATLLDGEFNFDDPSESVSGMLRLQQKPGAIGKRRSFLSTCIKVGRHIINKKTDDFF